MNRFLWGIALFVLAAAGGWAQSTWRGQAEVWSTADAPAEGYVAASNEFPRNSLLSVENYKTRKTIQVRVVSVLPDGSTALVLLNPRAAQALDIKTGEIPLVGVRMDPTGVDRPDNPDPDVNPLANKPGAVAAVTNTKSGTPAAVTPPAPVASVEASPAPTLVPEAKDTTARTPTVTSLDAARGSTTLDPNLLPLPALAEPEPVPVPEAKDRTPLAVADEPEAETPATPGKTVFVATKEPDPVSETPVEIPASTPAPVAEVPAEIPAEIPAVPPAEIPVSTPAVAAIPAKIPEPAEAPPAAPPAVVPKAPVPVAAVPVKPASASVWVSIPGKLEGPLLGTIPLLSGLEKGKAYVQLGAWASETAVLAALETMKSYVPVALYKAEGEKNPWRIVTSAPKGQLGLLLMHFRSQGFRAANMVKG